MKHQRGGQRECYAQVESRPNPLSTAANLPFVPHWKRALDASLIILAAPAWVPLMVGIGAGIKLLSPGPALFRQERVGFRGQQFMCFKFRTMHSGANTAAHEKHLAELIKTNRPMTKLDGQDPRLIPLARIVRSTGLDELPQLFNVLRGEMSLVGPRPCTPSEYDAYTAEQQKRTDTLPGLTGLWQVSGKNRTTFNEMVELDVRYLKTMSFRGDLAILFRTPMVLLEQLTETLFQGKAKAKPSPEALPVQIRHSPAHDASHGRLPERNSPFTDLLGK